MYIKSDMIKEIGPRKYHIIAAVRYKGRIYKAERKSFDGAFSRAVSEQARLKVELRARAMKEADDQARKYVFFSGLLDAFEVVHEYPKRMKCYADKLRRDIGGLHIDHLEAGLLKYFSVLNHEYVTGKKKDKAGKWERTDRLLANGTKNRILAIAKMVCRQAYRAGLIQGDPLKLVRPWPEKPRNRILSADELGRIRAKMAELEPWLAPAFEFSIRIPMRLSDLCSLTRDNLDVFNEVIRLAAQKTGAQQVAPLPPDMANYFKGLPKSQTHLFSRNGGSLGSINKAWRRVLEAAGVSGVRWHDLRHHACTWLSNSMGLKTHQLMVVGGWKRREMIEVYHNTQPETTAQEVGQIFRAAAAEQAKKTVDLNAEAS